MARRSPAGQSARVNLVADASVRKDKFGPKSPAGDVLRGIAGIELTRTALLVTDEALPFQVWASAVARLVPLETGASWWVGDAIAFGAKKYGHTYEAAVEATGRSLQTLKNLASVSRSVPPNMRDPDLPWRVHREVASLDPPEQRKWLARTKAASWSAEELRRRLRTPESPHGPDEFPEVQVEDGPVTHEYRCPRCLHEWSGDPRPEEEGAA
jgi:hypothetical protein